MHRESKAAIAKICKLSGFTSVSSNALVILERLFEDCTLFTSLSLTKDLIALITLSRRYSDIAHRTNTNLNDITLAFVEAQIDFNGLFEFLKDDNEKRNEIFIDASLDVNNRLEPKKLKEEFTHISFEYVVSGPTPNHISYTCPSFPNPHTFIQTPV